MSINLNKCNNFNKCNNCNKCTKCNTKYDKNTLDNLINIQEYYKLCEICCLKEYFIKCKKCNKIISNTFSLCIEYIKLNNVN